MNAPATKSLLGYAKSVPIPFELLTNEPTKYRFDIFNEHPPGPQPDPLNPYTPWDDTFLAWLTLAYRGDIERGGPLLDYALDREQRLERAKEVLTEDEFVLVEAVAVPAKYRQLPAAELEEMIRNGSDYIDAMWAACWLTLTGWRYSLECRLLPDNVTSDEFPTGQEIYERIRMMYGATIGVNSPDDPVWEELNEAGRELDRVMTRVNACEDHYHFNGPPPYRLVSKTIPQNPNWIPLQLVPKKPHS
jgi:hypothetical protein